MQEAQNHLVGKEAEQPDVGWMHWCDQKLSLLLLRFRADERFGRLLQQTVAHQPKSHLWRPDGDIILSQEIPGLTRLQKLWERLRSDQIILIQNARYVQEKKSWKVVYPLCGDENCGSEWIKNGVKRPKSAKKGSKAKKAKTSWVILYVYVMMMMMKKLSEVQ